MHSMLITRRKFVASATALALATPSRRIASAATPQAFKGRMDWDSFRTSPQRQWFTSAIASMRANQNESDPRSWRYWINVHLGACKHGVPYFLAWHRGCLFHLERQLQAISCHDELMIPYWDYYKNPDLPSEFTNPASDNPLYEPRVNTNVRQALTLAPFSETFRNLETGTVDSFEHALETAPHNPIHDLIGNVMATMRSTYDPIFWLHHANIDRLWTAWSAAGGGRRAPAKDSPYWAVNFSYGPALSMNASYTRDIRTDLRYYYQDETLPRTIVAYVKPDPRMPVFAFGLRKLARLQHSQTACSLPAATSTALPARKADLAPTLQRPAIQRFVETEQREIDATRLALCGVKDIALDQLSVGAQLRLTDAASKILQSVTARVGDSPFGPAGSKRYSSAHIVLDKIRITDLGKGGGYFYRIYLTTTQQPDGSGADDQHLLGTLGPFQIAGALNHARMSGLRGAAAFACMTLPATAALARLSGGGRLAPTLSFLRVNGDNAPAGTVIQIGEARIDLSTTGE